MTLNVDAAITIITLEPKSEELCEGDDVSFYVVADADGAPLVYQWRKEGVDIPGATASFYTLTNVTTADAGDYDVVIAGQAGFECSSTISETATLVVNTDATITPSGDPAPVVCVNNPISDITYTIGGSATNAVLTGALPNGVSGGFSGGVYTISGTPTESGTFDYTITTEGSLCTNPSLSGTITVNDVATISLAGGTATQSVCINNPVLAVSFAIGGNATGADIPAGSLPPGVVGSYNNVNGLFTISGTPTVSGSYPFTVSTTGSSCENQSLSGTITVDEDATITLTSGDANQSLCIGNPVGDITYSIGGSATGVALLGDLPDGVSGTLNGSEYTISGTPTESGAFNYTVTTTGPCFNTSESGVIQVDYLPDGGVLSPSVNTVCTETNSGTLTLEGYTGNVIRWESSVDAGFSWTPIPVTSNTYTYTNLPRLTLFRAVVGNDNCPEVYSGISRITVIPAFTPVITVSGGNVCSGEPVTLTATATILPDTIGIITGGDFNRANPPGWQIYENGVPISPFPASNDNERIGPWAETNGPKTFCGGNAFDSGEKKFAIVSGDVNSWMETPVFNLVAMSSAALSFDHAYMLGPNASAKVELSTDGGNTYNVVLSEYSGTLMSGMPNVVNDIGIDMSPYLGMTDLRIRFNFDSPDDCSVWAVDNITLPTPQPDVEYVWGPVAEIPGGSGSEVVVVPPTTTTYTLTVYIAGCPGVGTAVIVSVVGIPRCFYRKCLCGWRTGNFYACQRY